MSLDVLIEIPKGGLVKYEFDKEKGRIRVDRFLHGAMYFPFNYGYVEETLSEDNDPIDVVVLSSKPVVPGCLIKCQVVGLLQMEDEGGVDTKILAVPDVKIDPLFGKVKQAEELDQITKDKIRNFFEHYKDLEKGKWVKLKGWGSREKAEKEVLKAQERYKQK
ncbi:MAG: inorganic diphosphatase [Candidatus Pacebacteria bacterium]|nr:inorganic diphosphatase [Candidatus Paceibacterota bacterium]